MMKPLSQGTVLTSEFDDLLSDDTSPEWCYWWNLRLGISGYVFYQVFIDCFNFEVFSFDLHLLVLVFINQLDQFLGLGFIQDWWKTVVFWDKLINTVQDQVKLFRDAELIPAGDWHLHWVWRVRVSQTFFQIVEFHVSWNFDFDGHTAVLISWKSYSASDSEAAWSLYLNLKLESVDLSHTFDFLELYSVTIVEPVSFILVQINGCFLLLSDSSDMDKFWFLSS